MTDALHRILLREYFPIKSRLPADAATLSCRFQPPQENSVAAAKSKFTYINTSIFSMNAIVPCVIVYLLTVSTDAYSPGDRISALCRTHHDGFKSPWMDLTLQQMPKFRYADSAIIRTSLPMRIENGPEMKLNPKEDLKVSLLFAGSRHVLPLIVLFDAKQKKSLKSLTVTYTHDDFDILGLKFETIYAPPLSRVDPSHPSLTAFELVHRWEAIHDNDLRLGIVVMFSCTLLILVLMIGYIAFSYDRDLNAPVKTESRRESQGSMSDNGYISRR